jgi:selenocysteine-specific elongation factor
LLIVAADDSVMPQTVEHLEVLDLLGVTNGVVAVTKCDLVDEELAELVEEDVRGLLAETHLKDAPIVRVSSTTGSGLDRLRECLIATAERIIRDDLDQPFRLAVDRVFTIAGRGTVVTGSVVSGRIHSGESVDIWPIDRQARIREVQTHGRGTDEVQVGQRAAINLIGVDKEVITRGCELAAVGAITPTRLVDVRMCCLKSHQRAIKNQSKLRLCVGTREVMARCVSLDGRAIEPGEWTFAQLRCAELITVTYGQRFILRDENAARTAGGGVVLRAARRRLSPRHTDEIAGLRSLLDDEPTNRVHEVIRDSRFHMPEDGQIALGAGVSRVEVPGYVKALIDQRRLITLQPNDRIISAVHLRAFLDRAQAWLHRYHQSHPDEPGALTETLQGWLERKSDKTVGKVLLARLLQEGNIRKMGRYVCLREFAPALSAQDERLLNSMLEAFAAGGFQPPTLAEVASQSNSNVDRIRKLAKIACSTDQLVQINTSVYLHSDRERELREKVHGLYRDRGPFTVAQLREVLDSSRKFVVPIVEYLDRNGITRRSGDIRKVVPEDES